MKPFKTTCEHFLLIINIWNGKLLEEGRGLLFHFTVTRPVLLHCPKHSKALVLNQKWMSELPERLSKSSFLQNSSLLREKEGRI